MSVAAPYMSIPPMPPMPPGGTAAVRMVVVLRRFRDHDFRREQQARNRRRVLQRQTRDLGRIEDALFQHVAVLAGARRCSRRRPCPP